MVNAPGGEYGDPDDAVYVPGVDYLSGWCVAERAADEVNEALAVLGVDMRLVRAVPHAGVQGEAVVWLRPESARVIARALRLRARRSG